MDMLSAAVELVTRGDAIIYLTRGAVQVNVFCHFIGATCINQVGPMNKFQPLVVGYGVSKPAIINYVVDFINMFGPDKIKLGVV